MAYQMKWYVDQQVILARYWGDQTEEDVLTSLNQAAEMISGSPHSLVHIVNDVSEMEKPIPFLKMLNIVRKQELPAQMGWLMTVGERNAIVKFVTGGVSSVAGMRVRSMDTFEEAIDFLKLVDPSIKWDSIEQD